MGIMVGLPTSGGTEKDLQLNFGLTVNDQVEMLAPFLPAEWFLQSGIQLTWPGQTGHICWLKFRNVL